MAKQINTALLAATLSILLVGASAQAPAPPGRGQEWLSWTASERRVFVAAYMDGYLRGKTDACIAAGELFEQRKPVPDLDQTPDRRCFRRAKGYSENADDYTAVITDFYGKHPEHRDIPVEYFMLLFTDAHYKTVDDIEQGIRKGEVRTAF